MLNLQRLYLVIRLDSRIKSENDTSGELHPQRLTNILGNLAADLAIGRFGTFAARRLSRQFVMRRGVPAQQLARFGGADAFGGAFMRFQLWHF